MKMMGLLLGSTFVVSTALAEIKTQDVEYSSNGVTMVGYLAYDASKNTVSRPAILIVHDWMGLGQFSKDKAEKLARLGYVAFAADIYGKDVRPKTPKEAGELAGKYKS